MEVIRVPFPFSPFLDFDLNPTWLLGYDTDSVLCVQPDQIVVVFQVIVKTNMAGEDWRKVAEMRPSHGRVSEYISKA
jgi:hypothetical protein